MRYKYWEEGSDDDLEKEKSLRASFVAEADIDKDAKVDKSGSDGEKSGSDSSDDSSSSSKSEDEIPAPKAMFL